MKVHDYYSMIINVSWVCEVKSVKWWWFRHSWKLIVNKLNSRYDIRHDFSRAWIFGTNLCFSGYRVHSWFSLCPIIINKDKDKCEMVRIRYSDDLWNLTTWDVIGNIGRKKTLFVWNLSTKNHINRPVE